MKDSNLPLNAIHKKFIRLPITSVLTTNYDYMLETAYREDFDTVAKCTRDTFDRELKYSVYRSIDVDGLKFHHVHGEAAVPTSICLGY